MKPLKMEEPKLPDNNRITSCQRLDVFPPQLPALRIDVGQAFIFFYLELFDDFVFNQRFAECELLAGAD